MYSDYESNPQLRQAIEFACHQFYILHRKPFVLQLFASVAPLLEFPVSKLWRQTKTEHMRKEKALYSQLAVVRHQPPSLVFGRRLKGRRRSERTLWGEREGFGYDWRVLSWEGCKWAD